LNDGELINQSFSGIEFAMWTNDEVTSVRYESHRIVARVVAHPYISNGVITLKGLTENLLMAGYIAQHYWHNV
jgi:hypothetical protein